jgi:hypothetical protein
MSGKMAKQILYEHGVANGAEKIGLRFFRAQRGFILERFLSLDDGRMLVQILTFSLVSEFDDFRGADPCREQLNFAYDEMKKRLVALV